MDERIRQRISSFFKRWYSWIVQFLVWLLLIVRDNYAIDILNSLTDKYGGKIVKGILLILPKDVSGYALLLLVASVGAILIYDLIDTRRKEKLDKEQIFKLTAREPLEKETKEYRWASIDVENISPAILEKCFVVLDDVLDMQGKSVLQIKRKRRLLWSWGDRETSRDAEKDLVPGEPKVVDVATTSPSNNKATFETQAGQESKDKGVYEVIVTAHGRLNNQPKTKTFRFILEYTGGNVVTIINKGSEKWSNPNPKKTKRKNQPPTHSASPSS